MENKKHPLPDKSINEREPQEPNIHPSTGQHEPDIQDERSKNKHGNRPQKRRNDINPEETPETGNPEEYNDGEPVEEKSPRASNSL
jgi:hypothetical protein